MTDDQTPTQTLYRIQPSRHGSPGSCRELLRTVTVQDTDPRVTVVVSSMDETTVSFYLGVPTVADTVARDHITDWLPDGYSVLEKTTSTDLLEKGLNQAGTSLAAVRDQPNETDTVRAHRWTATSGLSPEADADTSSATKTCRSDDMFTLSDTSLRPLARYVSGTAGPSMVQLVLTGHPLPTTASADASEAIPYVEVSCRSLTIASDADNTTERLSAFDRLRRTAGTNTLKRGERCDRQETLAVLDQFRAARHGPAHLQTTITPDQADWTVGIPSGTALVEARLRGGEHPRERIPPECEPAVLPQVGTNPGPRSGLRLGAPHADGETDEHTLRLDEYIGAQRTARYTPPASETPDLVRHYDQLATDILDIGEPTTPVIAFDLGPVDVDTNRPVSLAALLTSQGDHSLDSVSIYALDEGLVATLAADETTDEEAADTWRQVIEAMQTGATNTDRPILIVERSALSDVDASPVMTGLLQAIGSDTTSEDFIRFPDLAVAVARADWLPAATARDLLSLPHRGDHLPVRGVSVHLGVGTDTTSPTTVETVKTIQALSDSQIYGRSTVTSLAAADCLPASIDECRSGATADVTDFVTVDDPLDDRRPYPFTVPVVRQATSSNTLATSDEVATAVGTVDAVPDLIHTLTTSDEETPDSADDSTPATTVSVPETDELPWNQLFVPDADALPDRLGLNIEREVIHCEDCDRVWDLPTKAEGAPGLRGPLTCCGDLTDADLEAIRALAIPDDWIDPIKYMTGDDSETPSPELCAFAAAVYRVMTDDCDPKLEYSYRDSMTEIRDYIGVEESEIRKFSNESDDNDADWFTYTTTPRKYYTLTAAGRDYFDFSWSGGEQWGHRKNDLTQTTQHIAGIREPADSLSDIHPQVESTAEYVEIRPDKVEWLPPALADQINAENTVRRLDLVGLNEAGLPVVLLEYERDNNEQDGIAQDQETMAAIQAWFDHPIDIIYVAPTGGDVKSVFAEFAELYPDSPLAEYSSGANVYRTNETLRTEEFQELAFAETHGHMEAFADWVRDTADPPATLQGRLFGFYADHYADFDMPD